ncbi:hypothetical protein [Thermoflexus sp.]|uniref:hypothetical protein n=1 Tax=Thermoflexus sp. TaxID=1969742 RepID=UPI0035E3FB07
MDDIAGMAELPVAQVSSALAMMGLRGWPVISEPCITCAREVPDSFVLERRALGRLRSEEGKLRRLSGPR